MSARDHVDYWCYTAFDDQEDVNYLVPNAETETKFDPTGIAVSRSVIDIANLKVSMSFFRPMEATSENDANLEADTEYGVYINWGLFDSHDDQTRDKVEGHLALPN